MILHNSSISTSLLVKARFTNLVVLERPFSPAELIKVMRFWLAPLIFEMITFAKEAPQQ